jgi:transcriptional regulator with XRE-family HTH domain
MYRFKMGTNKVQRDPTSGRVAANIAEARAARGLTFRDLHVKLRELGRPISPSGLHKIERGDRRVDVDDLVAIALALDTTPNQLLLGPVAPDDKLELTPGVEATGYQAWGWARGEAPFPPPSNDAESMVRALRFHVENHPGASARELASFVVGEEGGSPSEWWSTFARKGEQS